MHLLEEFVPDLALLIDYSAILVPDSVRPGALVAVELFNEVVIDISDYVDGVEASLQGLLTAASENSHELLLSIVVLVPHIDGFLDLTSEDHLLSRLKRSEHL